jgi:hypothetical protein
VYYIGVWLGRRNVEDIDGITYAKTFAVDVNPEMTEHDQIFPGVYQCEYNCTIDDHYLCDWLPSEKIFSNDKKNLPLK